MNVIPLGNFSATMLAVVLAAATLSAQAQPREAAPDQFGDRQSGRFGDPNQGYFGDASQGNFDQEKIKEPPPGAEQHGKVYRKTAEQSASYVSLPQPVDAAPAPAAAPTAVAAKPARKKAVKRKSKNKARQQ
jgi:hypothetical protein